MERCENIIKIVVLLSPVILANPTVYYPSRVHLQPCSTKEQERAQIATRRKEKLLIDGISLPFPEDLANWSTGSQYFPDSTMTDIETYLLKNSDRKSMNSNSK